VADLEKAGCRILQVHSYPSCFGIRAHNLIY
jgi:hypothetical protein